jgi:hypothetical protein
MRVTLAVLTAWFVFGFVPAPAHSAELLPTKLGAGFHAADAPIGVRWWYGEKAALDFNVGVTSNQSFGETLTDFTVAAGFPIVLHRWNRLTAEIRPALQYTHDETIDTFPVSNSVTDHVYQAGLELEAEVFVVERLSVSGSFGFAFASRDRSDSGLGSLTSWSTFGGNFAHLGFHLYFGALRSS